MNADDQRGPSQWGATSLEHFDQLARGVLRAAREAERELRRTPPDPEQPTWALAVLAGRAQAMLGHDGPAHPPVGAAAQKEFVCTSVKLAVDALSHRWAEADLGLTGVAGQADAPHLGERQTADAFDVLGRLMLPNSTPEGWTAAVLTDLARGDETWEAVVKVGKYILHPTFLAFVDDATRVVGEAVHNINVRRLRARAHLLRDHMGAAEPCRPAAGREQTHTAYEMPVLPKVTHQMTKRPERLARKRRIFKGVPEVESGLDPQRAWQSPESDEPIITPIFSVLDPQLAWQPPESDEPIITSIFANADADALRIEPDVSLDLDDPECGGRDLGGRNPFSL
ncbi:hypothetical protein [Streptomyces sp. NPDC050759]|uniref:hypothetical protein n=1 Tax=Streptomyces sp. NPDC050759 TaxID=3365635 RepID=UPI00378E6995